MYVSDRPNFTSGEKLNCFRIFVNFVSEFTLFKNTTVQNQYTLFQTALNFKPESHIKKMFINQHFNLFSKVCRMVEFLRIVNFRLNVSQQRLYICKQTRVRQLSRWKIYLHHFLTVAVIAQCSLAIYSNVDSLFSGKNFQFISRFLEAITCVSLTMGTLSVYICQKFEIEFLAYVNGLLNFSEQHDFYFKYLRKQNFLEWLSLLFAYSTSIFFTIWPPIQIILLYSVNPCTPALFGYWLQDHCSTRTDGSSHILILNIVKIIFVVGLNFWMLCVTGFCCALLAGCVLPLCTLSLRAAIEIFLRAFTLNGVSGNISSVQVLYRQVQLLGRSGNNLLETYVAGVAVGLIFAVSVLITGVIKLQSAQDALLYQFMFSFGALNDMVLTMVWFGGLASVYSEYLLAMKMTQRKVAVSSRNIGNRQVTLLTRKFLRSCAPVRMNLGDNNFVEQVTSLNCLNMSNNMTVQMLLLWQ